MSGGRSTGVRPSPVWWVLVAGAVAACGGGEERPPESAARPDAIRRADLGGEVPTEAHPTDGEGAVRVVPADPVVASSWGSWNVEWIAGPAGLPAGGGAVLQVSPFWGWSPPQLRRPGLPGFTTVGCSNPSARLDAAEGSVPNTIVVRIAAGELDPGDTLRFVYGDSTKGGPGSLSRTDRYAEEFTHFLIKTDGNGDGFFAGPADQPALRILPGPAARLAVAAPAVVAPGDPFEIRVHALDGLDNRASLPAGTMTLIARRLAEGTEASHAAPDTLARHEVAAPSGGEVLPAAMGRSGLYRLEAELRAEKTAIGGRNDLLLVERDEELAGILWGDIHCHSALSDGTGAPDELYAYAREVVGLDVCAVTDHDAHGLAQLAGAGWERVREATERHHEPGVFVTLLGYEWTNWTWGHRNVYFPGSEGEVFAYVEPGSDTPQELWERIATFGAMTIPHHPGGGPVAVDWSVPSPEERETVVEICSIHGSSEAPDVERGIYSPVRGAMVRDALNAGHELGILASGDTHDGHPGRRTVSAAINGLAAFRAGERTREAVWAALRERRVYGTSGPRILLATDWDGTAPGSRLPGPPAGALRVRVCAPEPIEVVEVIGPAGPIAAAYGGGRRTVRQFFAEGPAPEVDWLYVRVGLADGEVAWESPYWLGKGTR